MATIEYKKLLVTKLSTDFKAATEIVNETFDQRSLKSKEVLIKVHVLGVNATDLNSCAGRFYGTNPLPFGIGFEAVGEIIAVGSEVSLKVGQPVAYMGDGAYSEYLLATEEKLFPLPSLDKNFIVLFVCGFTAALGLDESGHIKKGDKVLITAAAGGTGHIAVQYAKSKGCFVIGTCSSESKAKVLKDLGCDHVIDYKKENLDEVLSKSYPDGVDVIWETIGGKTFEMLFNHLAIHGRLVVIGGISGYKSVGFPDTCIENLPTKLVLKSLSLNGFFLFNHAKSIPECFKKLVNAYKDGTLKTITDNGASDAPFHGISSVADAVNHLHSGKNIGKVIVTL